MTETIAPLTQEQFDKLRIELVTSYAFSPNLRSMVSDLACMLDKSKKFLAFDSAYYPIVQDLIIYLETAQEAIDDAMKDINDLAQEIKK